MEAEEDAERLLRRTEKRAFAAFKISFYAHFLSAPSSCGVRQFFIPGVLCVFAAASIVLAFIFSEII